MSDFAEYVRGKTIAVVGPAPAPHDQAAEVDAHDLVFRTSYGFTAQTGWKHTRTAYESGVFPTGYGTRVDVSFYNSGAARMATEGLLDAPLADIDWAIWKYLDTPLPKRGLCAEIRGHRPALNGSPVNVNQITGILWHLSHYEPADVTVFGADFYSSPFSSWYDPAYMANMDLLGLEKHLKAARSHDQQLQRRVVRDVRKRLGWPNGDDRYIAALDMTPEQVEAVLADLEDTIARQTAA